MIPGEISDAGAYTEPMQLNFRIILKVLWNENYYLNAF